MTAADEIRAARERAQALIVGDGFYFRGRHGWHVKARLRRAFTHGDGSVTWAEAEPGEWAEAFDVVSPSGAYHPAVAAESVGWEPDRPMPGDDDCIGCGGPIRVAHVEHVPDSGEARACSRECLRGFLRDWWRSGVCP